jgi:GT2 family glycosyltransferase
MLNDYELNAFKSKVIKMKEPPLSILWLNYNSYHFINVALESLQGVIDLDYSNYELIVVDNHSTDSSFHLIEDFIDRKMRAIEVKVIKLPKNLGYTGGNNVAYRARNRKSKYIVFLNNDAVPYSASLSRLIEFMESDKSLGSVQGITLKYDRRTIESRGYYLSELLTTYARCDPWAKEASKPFYMTYADGAYSVHRVSCIMKAVGQVDSIFDDYMFAYYDDRILGLKMWNSDFKVATLPFVAAAHMGSSSFGRIRPFQVYLEARALGTLDEISNSKYKGLIKLLLIDRAYAHSMIQVLARLGANKDPSTRSLSAALIKGYIDGVQIGKKKMKLGEFINLYKAPVVQLTLSTLFLIGLIPWVGLSGRAASKLSNGQLADICKY